MPPGRYSALIVHDPVRKGKPFFLQDCAKGKKPAQPVVSDRPAGFCGYSYYRCRGKFPETCTPSCTTIKALGSIVCTICRTCAISYLLKHTHKIRTPSPV